MSKAVLLITPYFAPQTHASVFRFHKLARYLHEYGWDVHVLTVATNYNHNEDPAMLADLPASVTIHRARYVEPTIRGIRMALGGRARTFAAQKAGRASRGGAGISGSRGGQPTPANRAYEYLRRHWVDVPDPYWTWVGPAVRMGSELVREFNIGAILTTALPYSCHAAGLKLKQSTGCAWIADFRDPCTYSRRMCSGVGRVFLRQRAIERQTLEKADAVTVLAGSYPLIYEDIYGPITKKPIEFIPTGLDEALLSGSGESSRRYQDPYFLFCGEFLREYDYSFFTLFGSAIQDERLRGVKPRIVIAGHRQINEAVLGPALREAGLTGHVEFLDHMPQSELYVLLRQARAGLLLNGKTTHWWTSFAKMADYVALRKPVLASVPDPSEARSTLERTGLGIFLDGPPELVREAVIRSLISEPSPLTPDQDAACERFTAKSQVAAFAAVLDSVTAR